MLEVTVIVPNVQPNKKKKKQKKIHGLPQAVFHRLQFIREFKENEAELTTESSIYESYAPRVLNSCSTPSRMPDDPLGVDAFNRSVKIPGLTPFFSQPTLPLRVPIATKKKIVIEPIYPSLIPLLMTAKCSHIDIRLYDVVCMRNSLRKIVANDEDFVISVVRINATIFLRRFAKNRVMNKSDFGFQFEKMCTTDLGNGKFDYNQLTEGQIGENKILMMGEVDAIRRENGEAIELKSKKSNATMKDKADWWLQSYLTGTKSIFFGLRSKDDDMIVSTTEEFDTEAMLPNRDKKVKLFNRLNSVLKFLFSNVSTGRSYILRGYRNEVTQSRCLRLFEVVDAEDKRNFTFITDELINKFSVNV